MASIKCGKCGKTHETVAEVRSCYGSGSAQASVRSNRYEGDCADCGGKVAAEAGRIDRGEHGWEVRHLAGECDALPAKPVQGPKTERASASAADHADIDYSAVPGGYYATVSRTGSNDYDFWYVTEGTRNPRIRFVKRYVGGSGPVRISRAESMQALRTILAEGTEVTGNRFADELGKCKACGLPLTDEVSRAARMGPICRSK